MLKGNLIHPELMAALSQCGHGDKVLIADGNYPLASRSGDARKIYLGLTPGLPDVPTVLKALQSVVAIERAEVMQPEDGSTPEIFGEFQQALGGEELHRLDRFLFYETCCQPEVRVAISTGEWRQYANLLLTVGAL